MLHDRITWFLGHYVEVGIFKEVSSQALIPLLKSFCDRSLVAGLHLSPLEY